MKNSTIEFVRTVMQYVFSSVNNRFTLNSRYSSYIDTILNSSFNDNEKGYELIKNITIENKEGTVGYPEGLYNSYGFKTNGDLDPIILNLPYEKVSLEMLLMLEIKTNVMNIVSDHGFKYVHEDIRNILDVDPNSVHTDIAYLALELNTRLPGYMLRLNIDVKTVELIMKEFSKETIIDVVDVLVKNNNTFPNSLLNRLIKDYNNHGSINPFSKKKDLIKDLLNGEIEPWRASNLYTLLSYRLLGECELFVNTKFMENK